MKILLLGKDGQVGWELQRSLSPLGEVLALGRQQADLEDMDALRDKVRSYAPDVIVNAAAYTAVDQAESEAGRAQRINAEAVRVLAEEGEQLGGWLVHYSTDYVFDGEKASGYTEDDAPNPLSVYGRTKLEGERFIRSVGVQHLIFRTSWVYSTRGHNFPKTMLQLAKEKDILRVVADQCAAPTSAEFIADVTALALYRLMDSHDVASSAGTSGTYHLAAAGETTWYGYAKYVLEAAQAKGAKLKVKPEQVQPISIGEYPAAARRPRNSRLDPSKITRTFGIRVPEWQYHVQRLVTELMEQQKT